MSRALRLATRASPLAMWQARSVAAALRRAHPGLRVALVTVISSGDIDRSTPLYRLGTDGIFVKEVQQAVLAGDADAAVHSLKDLPTAPAAGLALAAVLGRADARDCLVGARSIAALPAGAMVGTSSLRRQAQLSHARGDLRFTSIRGNVETRLRKVAAGEVAATVLAAAGLRRLGLARTAGAVALDPWDECTPAPGQGAIGVECRDDDRRARRLLAALDHRATRTATDLERRLLASLGGGCSLPLGAFAQRRDGRWRLRARYGTPAGLIEADVAGPAEQLVERALAALAGERPRV